MFLLLGVTRFFVCLHQVKRSLTYQERVGRAVGAIGGVLKAGSLTFIADKTRFNNIAIKLKQLRVSSSLSFYVRVDRSILKLVAGICLHVFVFWSRCSLKP
jgi:hypothetical protein